MVLDKMRRLVNASERMEERSETANGSRREDE